jgi:glycosidase
MLSLGASGFRFDAAKHVSPQDLSGILKKVQTKMGGQLPDDFFVWLEVLTGKIISIYHFSIFFPKVEKLILFGKDHHGMVLCLKVFLNKILARIQKLIKLK